MPNNKKDSILTKYKYHREGKGDGKSDHLKPVVPLDPAKIKTVDDLVKGMRETAFGARTIGEAAEVLHKMVSNKDTFVVLTLSGAMTAAKMSLLVCEMIESGMVQAIVSTGALMSHGLVEGAGLPHFQAPPGVSDAQLLKKGYNRIYDVIEPEVNLDEIEGIVFQALENLDEKKPFASFELWSEIGKHLSEHAAGPDKGGIKGKAILKSAYEMGVPIYTPAMSDSEAGGIDVYLHRLLRMKNNRPILVHDAIKDLDHFTRLMAAQKKWGIFTVGGGVPRNWAQQVGPCLDLISQRHDLKRKGDPPAGGWWEQAPRMYSYGVRICPDPPHFGHLSGCTYSEGVSWGKMDFEAMEKDLNFAEVLTDATIGWPLVLMAVKERLKGKKVKKDVFTGKQALKDIESTVEKSYTS